MNILKSSDVTKATGPNKISNNILKHYASTLCHPLSEIFTLCFSSRTFPIKWKEAHVQPIPKKGKSTNKNDYRPISLLSNISKVMETIITKQLQEFFDNNKILNTRNSGFKKGDSAVYRLLELTHDIYQGMEDRKHTCAVFLDISKAFDRVWHAGLFVKIEQMGINGNLYTLLQNFILNRKVVLNGKMSDWAYPNAGVPQGSVLEPLLFLIYINDINLDLDIPIYMFADDITLICQLKNLQDLEQILYRNLKNLRKWSKIQFSTVKTKCMMFSNIKIDQMNANYKIM